MRNPAKKLKEIVKGTAAPSTFGKDPKDPWSARNDITEGSLEQYLLAKGINPKFVSKETKISHAKSTAYLKWKRDHIAESLSVKHSPTELRQHALKKAQHMNKVVKHSDVGSDGLHKEETVEEAKTTQGTALDKFRQAAAERAKKHAEIEKKQSKDGSGMSSAIDRLSKHLNKEEIDLEEAKHYPYKFRATYHDPDTDKMTHVMDFKHRSLEAAKKHAEGSRLQRRDGKEDKLHSVVQMKEEQIDELKKSTLTSYKDKSTASLKNAQANRDAAEHGKNMSKGFADLHAKSDAIAKKRVQGLKGYLQRKTGMKPTSEDVFGDSQAATQSNFDGANAPDNTEPSTSGIKKRGLSKSARMIKALYKHHSVKEELYDSEKEDKSVATYGKKPKMIQTKPEDSFGDNAPPAAAVLSGGKTLTGHTRDTLEIDPHMKRPTRPDAVQLVNKKKK